MNKGPSQTLPKVEGFRKNKKKRNLRNMKTKNISEFILSPLLGRG